MVHAVVLGAGMVGSVIAADLVATKGFRVTVADRSRSALTKAAGRCHNNAKLVEADLSNLREVEKTIAKADLVIGALPSVLGFQTLKLVVEKGMRCCDISFMPEDFLELDKLARKTGAVCVADCGVAPGMSNLLAARGVARLDKAERLDIMVGGVPRDRHWPYQYKAGFSLGDVLEEYVRPSRVVEGGRMVIKEALSEPELVDFPTLGTLEAFNTDGLRSLATTLKVPHMRERTLRYPGHIELMRVFRDLGLFGLEPVQVGEATLRPRDLLAKLLAKKWTYEEGEEDLTVMRVVVEGVASKVRTKLTWDLFDRFDRETGASSMSRTTAFPCTSVSRMMVDGMIAKPGVFAPEHLEPIPGVLDRVLKELRARGIEYRASVDQIAAERPTRTRGGRTG